MNAAEPAPDVEVPRPDRLGYPIEQTDMLTKCVDEYRDEVKRLAV
jgi:hypothetical protein